MSIYVSMGVSAPKPSVMTSGTRRPVARPVIETAPGTAPTAAASPVPAKE
jgi:hypothetical protein